MAVGTLACSTPSPEEKSAPKAPPVAGGEPLGVQRLEDILVGSSYLGCGGGGGLAPARELIASDLAAGFSFRQIPVSDLADDAWVASAYALASLAPMSETMAAQLEAAGVDAPVEEAFRALERHLDVSFGAIILGEIGPLSLAEGLSIAARLGIPSLDADTVGRATPEINQHSVRVAGEPLVPAAAVSAFGDEIVLRQVLDPSREEVVFRTLSEVSRLLGVADAPLTGDKAKRPGVLVQGSVTLAENIGRAVREARAAGKDPVDAGRAAADGYRVFDGSVAAFEWRDEDGFLQGAVEVEGTGDFAGRTLQLEVKNEHLVARRDGEVIATCPDLISLIDRDTAEGLGNPDFERGQAVTALAFRCDPLWRTPAGLEVFSPRYFGYDVDYLPVEDRLA